MLYPKSKQIAAFIQKNWLLTWLSITFKPFQLLVYKIMWTIFYQWFIYSINILLIIKIVPNRKGVYIFRLGLKHIWEIGNDGTYKKFLYDKAVANSANFLVLWQSWYGGWQCLSWYFKLADYHWRFIGHYRERKLITLFI